jgi:ABC-type sugar transport system ATPase subunit
VAQVEFRQVSKTYPGNVPALIGFDLTVRDGERLTILGPSGSGKSTILRLIAGLEELSSGSLWLGNRRADGLPPSVRDVAMVFQNPALYPHLSVFENIAFSLRARRVSGRELRERVRAAAGLLRLEGLLDRRPRTLSGGEAQRVALARAIARRPTVLLLDEPMSSLDAPLRVATRADLVDLHQKLGMTMVLVTHDQAEAMSLGERVAVMDRGRLVQVGTPDELYDRPVSRFVASFVGWPPMSLLPGALAVRDHSVELGLSIGPSVLVVLTGDGETKSCTPTPVEVGIRPEAVSLAENANVGDQWRLEAPILRLEPMGESTLAVLAAGDRELATRLPRAHGRRIGEVLRVSIDPRKAYFFNPDGSLRANPDRPSVL